MSRAPRPGDRIDFTVEGLRDDGLGSAALAVSGRGSGSEKAGRRLDRGSSSEAPGRSVELRIEDGLPGESGEILLTHVGRQAAFGRMIRRDAATASADRRGDLPCPRWTAASPCRLMHLTAPAQAAFKRERVRAALASHGLGDVAVAPTLVASADLGWRARTTYVVARERGGRLVLGAYRRGSHRVQDMAGCLLEEPAIAEAAAVLRDVLDEAGVAIADRGLPVVRDAECGAPRDPEALLAEGRRRPKVRTPNLDPDGLRYGVLRAEAGGRVVVALLTPSGRLSAGAALEAAIRRRLPGLRGLFVGASGPGDAVFGRGPLAPVGDAAPLEESFGGLKLGISPAAFFQINRAAADRLHALAAEAALGRAPRAGDGAVDGAVDRNVAGNVSGKGVGNVAGNVAGTAPAPAIIDVYCGVGALSLRMAAAGARVTGIEIIPEAVDDARRNASANGLEVSARFVAADAADALAQWAEAAEAVVLNPPRKGCDRPVLDAVARRAPRRVVYVSCNPDTLARDLAVLAEAGYRIRSVQPVDLFPHSEHVEVLAVLDASGVEGSRR
jgi:23S rRNA (uracil1939-C5)-methyltransferase